MRRVIPAVLGALILLVAGIALLGGDGPEHRMEVQLELRDAGGLRKGSQVRVGGAPVGSVRDLQISSRNTALATLDVKTVARPGRGARASVRALNLLGEKFVDLDLGDRAQPLERARIAMARTSTPVEIDDLLDVLDPTTRDRLALLIGELGIALGHRGEQLRDIVASLPPTLEDAAALLRQLGQDTDVLDRLLVEGDRVTDQVARERGPLGRLIATADRAFAAPAANQAGLQATLRETPSALAQLRATLRRLDAAGADLRPAARGLRVTAPVLTRALSALPGFREAAAPALAQARTTGPALRRLGRGAAPVVRRLRGTSASLSGLAQDADALLSRLDETFAADLLGVMQGWAQAIQTRDGVGHLFRVSLSLTPDIMRNLDSFVTGPRSTPARRRPAVAPQTGTKPPTTADSIDDVKRKTQDTARPAVPVLDAVGKALDGLLGGGSRGPQPAPKTRDDVTPLLDYLLGR
jgi:virulence factor Mce-like protein